MTGLDSVEQTDDMAKELNDRFGPLPVEVQNLLYAVKLKALGHKAGVESISTNDDIVTIRLFPGLQFNRQKLDPILQVRRQNWNYPDYYQSQDGWAMTGKRFWKILLSLFYN